MQNYLITIFTKAGVVTRNITAPNRRNALNTALNTLPDDEIPTCLICKTHADVCIPGAGEKVQA